MYSVTVESYFSSAHNLRGYKGKCEDLHGHNWKVAMTISSATTDKTGMVHDFKYLKALLHAALEKLDHKYINNVAYFKKVNPTSENIARYIYDTLKKRLPDLASITVWENISSYATYEE